MNLGIPEEEQVLTHTDRRLQGGQHTVIVTVKPRLQKDKWSMYWKESMCTKTECLEAIEVEVDTSSSMSDLTTQVAERMGWPPKDSLKRLEGFTDPWEFGVFKGRALKLDQSLSKNDITSNATITVVRRMLIAEAWKSITDLSQVDADEVSSSSDSEDWEQKF